MTWIVLKAPSNPYIPTNLRPRRDAKYCNQCVCMDVCLFVCLSVCLFVCLSVCLFVCLPVCLLAYLKNDTHVQISPNFLHMLPVARGLALFWRQCDKLCTSGFVDDVICFHITDRIGKNQRRLVRSVQFAIWRHRGRNLPTPTVYCFRGKSAMWQTIRKTDGRRQ